MMEDNFSIRMTMQIDSAQTLAGVSVLKIRHFFRQRAAHHRDSFSKQLLMSELRLSDSQADKVLEELTRKGYVSSHLLPDNQFEWQMTKLARELVRSSAARRISRKTAQHALEGLLLRAERVNADRKYLYSICSVVVFGSYLSGNERLGDLDVAVELAPRISDPAKRTNAHLRYARDSGRRFGNFTEELFWAEAEIYQVLKARQRTLSIQPWYSFLRMEKKEKFQYEVILGDADKIARDLANAEKKWQNQPSL